MINWFSVTVEVQRRQDEIAAAAEHNRNKHIMRQPGEARKKSGHIMAEVLILVGNWLVNLGCRLQAPYARLTTATRSGMQQHHIMTPQKAPCAS
jgi:hypothetical protein